MTGGASSLGLVSSWSVLECSRLCENMDHLSPGHSYPEQLNSPCEQLLGHHLPNVSCLWSHFGAESGKGWRCCGTWSLQVLLFGGTRTSAAAGDNGDIPHRAEPLLCNNGHSLPGQGDTVKRDTSGRGSGTRRRPKRKEPVGCAPLPLPSLPSNTSYHCLPPATLSGATAQEVPVPGSAVLLDRAAAMATLTLGQMLDAALGSARAGHIDFEQLHNLLNAMLLHLGLKDLLVLESGEPLEGAEESPFAFLKDLKQRVEANEKEIAEVRALCQELREEVNEVKLEQSHMAEDMQYMLQNFNMEELQNMMDELRNQLMESLMSALKNMLAGPSSRDKKSSHYLLDSEDDQGLIVIGNEITLVERPKTPKHGDSRPASPSSRTQGSEKEETASSDLLSTGENDVGQSDTGPSRGRSGMGRRGMRQNMQWGDTGQNDTEQKDMGRSTRWSDRGQNGMGQDDMGQDDTGQKPARRSVRWSDRGQDDMGQIKDEESEISISEVKALPRSLDSPPEMSSMEEIKEEETKKGISKKKGLDGSFTTSEMHPRALGTHIPVQRVQSVRGHPGSQNLWIPAESVAGTSSGSRLSTPREGRGGGTVRMEAHPAEAGMMLLRMPSSEYSPCDPLVKLPGQRSEFIPSTPPASPGLSMRLPHLRRQEHREQPAEGYSRRSPMYSGGKHTSVSAVQPMEPLLPDPNMPGTYELMGRDGVVYRGRIPPETD